VAHVYNPSYTGGRNQEDLSSKPAQANSLKDLIFNKPITKRGLVEYLKVGAVSSNPSVTKRKKKKTEINKRRKGTQIEEQKLRRKLTLKGIW
jgi:hypothetical protein